MGRPGDFVNAAKLADATVGLVGRNPWVSEMRASSPGSLLRGLHHRFLHTVLACPIQANLVAVWVIEIGMPPTPGHHAW